MSEISCRHAFTAELLSCARVDGAIVAVTSDAKGSVTLADFETALPAQFVETGIAEQNAVGIAAGLANGGRRPFVCGPACFYSARSFEQVKNDLAYADANVKVVGVSGGVSYGALGSTHHSLHDIAAYRAIPNLSVILPSDRFQTAAATRFLAGYDHPVYMRIGRGAVPDVYDGGRPSFRFGEANTLRDGGDCTIVAIGEMVYHALAAAELLEAEGIAVTVIDSPCIKPFDSQTVLDAAKRTGAVVTVEEHSVLGGLGATVAELLSQHHPTRMRILGFPDAFAPAGTSRELFEHYGLTGEGIAASVCAFLKQKGEG
ncbi:MAG: transketolase family protein [Spirochaetota bacterium]